MLQGLKAAVYARFIFEEHKDLVQKRMDGEKAQGEAARFKLQSAALMAKVGSVLGKKQPVVMTAPAPFLRARSSILVSALARVP